MSFLSLSFSSSSQGHKNVWKWIWKCFLSHFSHLRKERRTGRKERVRNGEHFRKPTSSAGPLPYLRRRHQNASRRWNGWTGSSCWSFSRPTRLGAIITDFELLLEKKSFVPKLMLVFAHSLSVSYPPFLPPSNNQPNPFREGGREGGRPLGIKKQEGARAISGSWWRGKKRRKKAPNYEKSPNYADCTTNCLEKSSHACLGLKWISELSGMTHWVNLSALQGGERVHQSTFGTSDGRMGRKRETDHWATVGWGAGLKKGFWLGKGRGKTLLKTPF